MVPLAAWRADEHFPMSSTVKTLLCGAVLARVDRGEEWLDRRVDYSTAELVSHSQVRLYLWPNPRIKLH